MRHFLYIFFLNIFALCFSVNSILAQPEVTPALQEALAEKADEEFISVNIRLLDQYDSDLLYSQSRAIKSRADRRSFVVNELKQFSQDTQAELLSFLAEMEAEGKVRAIRPLWIGNLVNCEARPEVIQALTTRKDLARIDYNQERDVLMVGGEPSGAPVAKADNLRTPANLAWNVTLVNADQAWEQGFTGEGAIVAVMDTGINYNHHDITDNMWEHSDYPNHGYNFVDNNHNTMDFQSHGTHCAGTVAGTGASGTGTGIAPGATIMNLKVLGDTGSGTEAGVWAGIEFAVEYGAHVMSLSLGWQHSWNPDRSMWRTTMNNALSAGVIAAVASGNEGQWGAQPPSQVRTPGDVPPPWQHPDQTQDGGPSAVVSVGSTTSSDALSSFSSKGPVTWQNIAPFNDYNFNPGTGLIRPDVTAPGSDILSLAHNNVTGYTTKSGTSMAAPAVAGLMALMISKNPNLTPEEISQIIEESAVPMTTGKSNTFGSGRINALAAINQTPYMGITYLEHTLDDSEGNNNGIINAGEYIKLNLTFQNPTDEDIPNVVIHLSVESPFISLTNNTFFMESFPAEQTITFEEMFSFYVSEGIHGNHEVKFFITTYSQNDPADPWEGSFVEIAEAPELVFSNIVVDDTEGGNSDGHLDPGEIAWLTVTLTNNGQMASTPGTAFLISENHWVAVLSYEQQHIPSMEPGNSMELQFQVAAFHDTPLESAARLLFNAVTQEQEFVQEKSVIVGEAPFYSEGDIPSTLHYHVTTGSSSVFPGLMTVSIPEGATITGIDVEYAITSRLGVNMNQQLSFLRCISPGGTTEAEVSLGQGNEPGTYQYARRGLTIANNVQGGGDIDFQLHVFRNHGGVGSNTTFVYAPNQTWKIIVYYELPGYDVTFRVGNQYDELLEGAEVIVGSTSKTTNEAGEALFELPEGSLFYSVLAENHRPLMMQAFDVAQGENVVELSMLRVFQALFSIADPNGNPVQDAIISIDGESHSPGQQVIENLENGTYAFSIEAPGFNYFEGEFEIADDDAEVNVVLEPEAASELHFFVKDEYGNAIHDAVIVLNGIEGEPGVYVFDDLEPGTHSFLVYSDCYLPYGDQVTLSNQNLYVDIVLTQLAGDANDDGEVNVLDVIAAVTHFLGHEPQPFCLDNADINDDGIVDILDVIAIINIFTYDKIILQPMLHSESAHLFLHQNGITIESDGTMAGLQLELLGANIHMLDLQLALDGFELAYTTHGDKLKAIIYSPSNAHLPRGNVELIGFNYAGDLNWGNVHAGNLNAWEMNVQTHQDESTQLDDLHLVSIAQIFPNPAKDKVSIAFNNPGGNAVISLLNTAGKRIKRLQMNDDGYVVYDLDISGLQQGVYFITIESNGISTHKLIVQ